MIKSMVVVAVVAVLLVGTASAVDPSKRQQCVNETSRFISKVTIDAPVQELVSISRHFYADLEDLIKDDVPSREYEEALLAVGRQPGCKKIDEHMMQLNEEVDCYMHMLEDDEDSLLDISRVNEKAKMVIEAYFACNFAKSD